MREPPAGEERPVWSDRWAEVDEFVSGLLAPGDEALEAALKAGVDAGLPEIQVSPPQARLLEILARSIGARTVLEFGTLAGYSTIWAGAGVADRSVAAPGCKQHPVPARSNEAREERSVALVVDLLNLIEVLVRSDHRKECL